MIIMLCLRWWYGTGWRWAFDRSVNQRVNSSLSMFSVSSLAKTWLSPFKQTQSDARRGSIDLKVQAAVDNFVSRIMGAIARTVLILCGLILAVFSLLTGLIFVLVWPVIPLGPFLALTGLII